MKFIFRLILYVTLFFLAPQARAQTAEQRHEFERVFQFYRTNFPQLKDGNRFFGFCFVVDVEKDRKGRVRVQSLTATDSIAYKVYPKYDFFKTVDFGVFMKKKKKATFAFPVYIQQDGGTVNALNPDEPASQVKLLLPYSFDQTADITRYIVFPLFVASIAIVY